MLSTTRELSPSSSRRVSPSAAVLVVYKHISFVSFFSLSTSINLKKIGEKIGAFSISHLATLLRGWVPQNPHVCFSSSSSPCLFFLAASLSLSLSDDDDDGEAALSVLLSSKGGESIRRASTRTQNVLID